MKIIPALKWHRLFDECEDTSTLINRTVIDIERGLNKIKVIKDSFPFSFLSGHFGLALFNSYFYKANFQERSVANAISNIKTGLDALSQANVSYSFCNGLSGILWTLKCFEKDNFINEDTLQTSTLNDLFSKGLDEMGNRNYDYLHGALGICLPALLNLNQKNSYVFLEKITQKLKETVETTTDQYKWESYNPTTQTTEFNLGLSHGMPSIIVILSLIYEANIQKDLCLKLLTGSINWLLSQKLPERSLSIFPYTVPKMETKKSELYPSRLAWCYGDLGVARSLWLAGKGTNNDNWKNEAIEILLHASKRRNVEENQVVDAGLCHGSAGIAHIFNRFYQDTRIEDFKEAARYWFGVTLDFAKFEDGIGGYKKFQPEWENKPATWVNSAGLLEGSAGIGLALLAAISDVEPKWDRCLLLS